jgi:regulator of RNase E activity RraA
VVVSHGYITIGEADIPVEVGGLVVRPGDILHADPNGVVSIPPAILDDLPDAIDKILTTESEELERMRREGRDRAALKREIQH